MTMDRSEAATLLGQVAARDGREVGIAEATAWANDLPDVTFADAQEAVRIFFRRATRDTRNWIFPGDVLAIVTEIQVQRIRSASGTEGIRSAIAANPLGDAELDRQRARESARFTNQGW